VSLFCGERVGDSSTVEQRTLTPLIKVRILVPQPVFRAIVNGRILAKYTIYYNEMRTLGTKAGIDDNEPKVFGERRGYKP
jgi:hypothetical protein